MSYMEAGPIDRPILVIASSHEDYALWCRTTGTSRSKAVYVSGWEQLYGWGRVNIVELEYPHWWTEEDTVQLSAIKE